MRRWSRQIKLKLNQIREKWTANSPSLSCCCNIFRLMVLCVWLPPPFFSAFLLFLSFLSSSTLPLPQLITSPKNVFLQVFNTLFFEERSKWLLCLCFVVLNASCIKSPPGPGLCASSSPKLHLHPPLTRGGSPVLHC